MSSLLAASALAVCGCDEQTCVEDLVTDCDPLYDPTFEQVFSRTLLPTCAVPGGACHSSTGQQGGLVFEDVDEAYTLLVGATDDSARVLPGDAMCSSLVVRLEANDSTVMPPGAPLDAAERCAITQWIESGAAP